MEITRHWERFPWWQKVWRILPKIQKNFWSKTTKLSIQRQQIQNTEFASKSAYWCRWKCDWSQIWWENLPRNKKSANWKTYFVENDKKKTRYFAKTFKKHLKKCHYSCDLVILKSKSIITGLRTFFIFCWQENDF